MKKKALFIAVAFLVIPSLLFAKEIKIGVVDLNRALNQSERGKKAKEELKKEFQKKTKEIEAKKAEVDALREELEKKGSLLSPTAKKKKEEEYRAKLRELKHLIDDSKAELATKESELSSQILKELIKLIRDKAKKEGYSLILEKNGGVIYCDPSWDLTRELIRTYDAAQPSPMRRGKTKGKK